MAFKPVKQVSQAMAFPAPVKGVVAHDPMYNAGDIGMDSAIWLYNMIAGEYGCRVRKGSREWATGLLDADNSAGEVRTLMFYNSVKSGGSPDEFFATTSKGIYQVTLATETPVLVHTWANQDKNTAGWCSYANYTNVAGDHYLLICDEANGYWIYNGTTFTQGTFTGSPKPEPEDLVQVVEWNGRIWFVERDSARAWFLDPLALTGDITPMDVGSRFIKGGHLVQNVNWTMDDGAGMDDKLIQISSSGDVLVWTGINPTTADDMVLQGKWYVGQVPEGRRVMSNWGGEVLILTRTGVIRASSIVEGVASTNPQAHVTNNIARYIRASMTRTVDDYGWSMEFMPSEGCLVITSPPSNVNGNNPVQFIMNVLTGAWSIYRDLDMLCVDKNNSGFFFGTRDGRVMLHEGYVDEVPLNTGTRLPKAITFSLLTHYSHMGNPATWKRPQFCRPSWIGDSQPTYGVQMRYDFDIKEVGVIPPYKIETDSLWDIDLWDSAIWGSTAQNYLETLGVRGMGRHVAIALKGSVSAPLSYIGCDLIGDYGGLL